MKKLSNGLLEHTVPKVLQRPKNPFHLMLLRGRKIQKRQGLLSTLSALFSIMAPRTQAALCAAPSESIEITR
jgi:hypothetical protein